MPILFTLMAAVALAQEPAPVSPDQQAAEKILTGMNEYYAGLKSFKADIQVTLDMRSPERKTSMRTGYSLAVRRPHQMALILRKSDVDGKPAYDGRSLLQEAQAYALDLICDGKDVYYYFSPAVRQDVQDARQRSPDNPGPLSFPVSRFKAPADLDGLDSSKIRTEWELGLIHRNVLGLVQKQREKSLAEFRKMGVLRDAGIEVLKTVTCRHLKMESSMIHPSGGDTMTSTFHWWIEDGPEKKLLKESMDERFGTMEFSQSITYANWVLNEPLTDADFALPPGVEKFSTKK